MPEMGIVGRAQLEAILPSTLDTRSWDYRAQGDYAHYPLTGFFAHESAEVWDLYFSASKQPVGATYNHPFYSTDRQQYVYAGELALGERILTQSGDTVQFLIKRPHEGLSTQVYNLEVWRAHNFLVTERGMVVHNNGCMAEMMGEDPITCLLEILKKQLKDPKLEAALEADLKAAGKTFRDELSSKPELLEAWEALNNKNDPNTVVIRQNVDNLKKLDEFKTSSSKSLAELQDEYEKLPNHEKQAWLDHLEYRSVNGQVAKAGNKGHLFNPTTFATDAAVPNIYSSDFDRFFKLSRDPAHERNDGTIGPRERTHKTRMEAMAGLEAERQGLVKEKITRFKEADVEFVDGDGHFWDVKTGAAGYFKAPELGKSIKEELGKEPLENPFSKILEKRRVIIDCTYLNDNQLAELRTWISANFDADEKSRIIEVNVQLP